MYFGYYSNIMTGRSQHAAHIPSHSGHDVDLAAAHEPAAPSLRQFIVWFEELMDEIWSPRH